MKAPPPGYEISAGVVVRSDSPWLEAAGLADLERAFLDPGEPRGPIKSLVRFQGPQGTVFVKRYQFRPLATAIEGLLKFNPPVYSGPREFENLLELRAAGFRVPLPLACGEDQQAGIRRSFVALAQLPGTSLEDTPAPDCSYARKALLDRVANLARRLHAAGFWHRDLYACNLFAHDELGLGFLDCERVGRRLGGPPRRWRVKDLAALDFSLTWPSERERLHALRRYLDPGAEPRPWLRAIRRKAEHMARHGRKGP